MRDYWDSFDCQIQCEEIYRDEDFYWENDYDEYEESGDDFFND